MISFIAKHCLVGKLCFIHNYCEFYWTDSLVIGTLKRNKRLNNNMYLSTILRFTK